MLAVKHLHVSQLQTQQDMHDNVPNETTTAISTDVGASPQQAPMQSVLESHANVNTKQFSYSEMLERFVEVDNFKWSSSDVILPKNIELINFQNSVTSYLKSYPLPQTILTNSAFIREKLNNYMLFKSDIEIDIKVNANPFQQGALMMVYFPKSNDVSKFRSGGNEFLSSVSSAPHKVLFLEQGNTMSLTVPYANTKDYIDLTQPDDSFGVIRFYVIAPLEGVTSSEQVECTVRMRFVNIDVQVPTDNSLLATKKYNDLAIEQLRKKLRFNVHDEKFFAQSSEGEVEGPISKLSSGVTKVAEVLTDVPVIGKFASPVAWVARGVHRVATMFGWSKPVDLTMPTQYVAKPAAYMGNTEGKDTSYNLAQISDNMIDSSSFVPSGQDEMTHEFIFSRPNYLTNFSVPKTRFTDKQKLFAFTVAPVSGLNVQTDGFELVLGSLGFTASLYKLWRGGINYTFDISKTVYHSGRFIAIYFPNKTIDQIPESYTDEMTTNLNMIYDLQAKADSELSISRPFTIPFTSSTPWKKTLNLVNSAFDQDTLENGMGTVGLYAYNELVSPDTVSQDIYFLLRQSFDINGENRMRFGIPQIQIEGGFVGEEEALVPELFAEDMTAIFGRDSPVGFSTWNTMGTDFSVIGSLNGTNYLFGSTWFVPNGTTTSIPDGTYTVREDLTLYNTDGTAGVPIFPDPITVQFVFTVTSGVYDTTMTIGAPIVSAIQDINDVYIEFSPEQTRNTHGKRFKAESDPGSDDIPQNPIAKPHNPWDVAIGTTGEYAVSLRPLIKRFTHTRNLATGVPHVIAVNDFLNLDDSGLDPGHRATTRGNTVYKIPESWLNLISYLYRFSAGSTRSKIFMTYNDIGTASLNISDELLNDVNSVEEDPAFVQAGVVNNALEVNVPYYSQLRARINNSSLDGLGAKGRYFIEGPAGFRKFYEAAGDDFNMWFMIGPPVMRSPTTLPAAPPDIS